MFKIIKYITFFLLILNISFLNKDEKKELTIKSEDIELQMIEAYQEGFKSLQEGDVIYAAKQFNQSELLFPQSEWAAKAALMAAYSYYSQAYYYEAISELNRYLKTYPKDTNLVYAHYLLGMCYYESIIDEKKDLSPIIEAKRNFNIVLKKYPETDFALDAEFKLNLIQETLASKEMYIAKYYIKYEKWIAAINRLSVIVEEYDTTIYVEEALHRLVEIHYKIGLVEESKRYASLLGYNYKSSRWYEESYKIFNMDYEVKTIQKTKKDRNFVTRKILSLFK